MRGYFQRLARNRSGQGMTEYIIIVALIAIFAIGTVTLFGDNIKALFAAATDVLAGEQDVTPSTEVTPDQIKKTTSLKESFSDNVVR